LDTGRKLDKDVFRENLGNLRDAYTEVADRLGIMPKLSVGSTKPTLVK
jgi:phosphoribosylaminoimidazole-succinocarboxamide synthase